MSIKMRQLVEKEIGTAIVDSLLSAGFHLSTDYGDGESPVSDDRDTVLAAMFLGDEDRLYVYAPEHLSEDAPIGWAYLVYGNDGWDVLSDYTVNLEKYIGKNTPADRLAEKYGD
jgi:hypothetical protein